MDDESLLHSPSRNDSELRSVSNQSNADNRDLTIKNTTDLTNFTPTAKELFHGLRVNDHNMLVVEVDGCDLSQSSCAGPLSRRYVPIENISRIQIKRQFDFSAGVKGLASLAWSVVASILVPLFTPSSTAALELLFPGILLAIITLSSQLQNVFKLFRLAWNAFAPACSAIYTLTITFTGNATTAIETNMPVVCGADGVVQVREILDEIVQRRAFSKGATRVLDYGKLDDVGKSESCIGHLVRDFGLPTTAFSDVFLTSEYVKVENSSDDSSCCSVDQYTDLFFLDDIGGVEIVKSASYGIVNFVIAILSAITVVATNYSSLMNTCCEENININTGKVICAKYCSTAPEALRFGLLVPSILLALIAIFFIVNKTWWLCLDSASNPFVNMGLLDDRVGFRALEFDAATRASVFISTVKEQECASRKKNDPPQSRASASSASQQLPPPSTTSTVDVEPDESSQ